jgi:zinc/manganese transport system substrate-binding protein
LTTALAALVMLGLLAGACSSSAASGSDAPAGSTGGAAGPAPRHLRVVAAENVWGDILSQIGGAQVTVTSIIRDPNTDPHEYSSDVQDAVAVAKADLVVENGLGYDDFMSRLLSASPRRGRSVLSVQTVLGITGSDANPHLWYATDRLPQVTAAFAAALGRLDPADAATYVANAHRFDASLQPALQVIARIRARYAGDRIAYTERVPGYLTQAAGLVLGVPTGFTLAVEDGQDPSPADTAAFDRALTTRSVRVLLFNRQVTDPQTVQIRQLAVRSGVPVVGVSETLPAGSGDFQSWQLAQDTALFHALGG